MILNPFKCESCDEELQPENIGINFTKGVLVRVCLFCGNQVSVTFKGEEKCQT